MGETTDFPPPKSKVWQRMTTDLPSPMAKVWQRMTTDLPSPMAKVWHRMTTDLPSPISKVWQRIAFKEDGSWSSIQSQSLCVWGLHAEPAFVEFNTAPLLICVTRCRKSLAWMAFINCLFHCILRFGSNVGGTARESSFAGGAHHMWERHWAVLAILLVNCLILLVVMLHYTNKQLVLAQLWAWETLVVVGYYFVWYATVVVGESCTFSEHFGALRVVEHAVEIVIMTPLLVIAACLDSVMMPKRMKCMVILLMIVERIWMTIKHYSGSGIFSDEGMCNIGILEVDARTVHSTNANANITIIIFLAKSLKHYCLGEHFAVIRPKFTLAQDAPSKQVGADVLRASSNFTGSSKSTSGKPQQSKPLRPAGDAISMSDYAWAPGKTSEAGPLGPVALSSAGDVREGPLLPAHPVPAPLEETIAAPASLQAGEEKALQPPHTEAMPVIFCGTVDEAHVANVMPQLPIDEGSQRLQPTPPFRAPASNDTPSTLITIDEHNAFTADSAPEEAFGSASSESILDVIIRARDDLLRQEKAYQMDLAIIHSQMRYLSAEAGHYNGARFATTTPLRGGDGPFAEVRLRLEGSTPDSHPEHAAFPEPENLLYLDVEHYNTLEHATLPDLGTKPGPENLPRRWDNGVGDVN